MGLKDYVVAIPSYRRSETLRDKTLKVLQDYKIDPKKIYIFVANEDEKKIYTDALPVGSYHKMVVGKPGIKNIRNFMPNYFPEGQYIFYMDDDIYEIYENRNPDVNNYDKKNNKLKKLPSLHHLIGQGFTLSEKTGLTNWGVYPVLNAYFMKPTTNNINDYVQTKLCYNIGFMTGVINNKKAEVRTIDDKEDYERSIKYYLKDGGLLRFNNITAKTKCYKEPGGMQVERTKKRIHDSAVYLTKVYPELCSLNTSKKSGFTEIRLRDKRPNKPTIILDRKGNVDKKVTQTKTSKKKISKKKRGKKIIKSKRRKTV
tara:strand:+ start:1178 stop:2119 length:942 start_codon:yes stop_codon:yes gene_type:complete